MPDYLAPGVYVEDVESRPKVIEGVSTSVCGFVGPTRSGPLGGELELLTAFSDFERIYGSFNDAPLGTGGDQGSELESQIDCMANSVRSFFENGGSELYIARIDGSHGSSDEGLPAPAAYEAALESLSAINEISIVAAPGFSAHSNALSGADNEKRATQIAENLISHCERMRYRLAVLDSPDNYTLAQVRAFRAQFDSKYAAIYYPWITVLDPADAAGTRKLNLPPSSFVAGIYARVDGERGVSKAPANEVVRGAVGLEAQVSKAQQDILNSDGINCFRIFADRGVRVWGARTVSFDPEWKYVNVRRYFLFVEHSIDEGTQWVVFEPNGERLWEIVRRTIEDFLLNEWRMGNLLGDKPERAFFVRCDRSTMTQNDLDNGRLVCMIGLAPLKPAEFVIFRIGQWTADRKD